MRIVLDTNVLVSGLLSPFNAPGEIVRMSASGIFQLCYDARIISEYKLVLSRPKFGFSAPLVDVLIEQIEKNGVLVASAPLVKRLPDPGDEPFLEAAVHGRASCLVTGNVKDYPAASREGVKVLLPSDFLDFYRTRQKSA
jgi:putative PIN family toxin of toxin-antitoxin system